MNYWITTHWPLRKGDDEENEGIYWVYLPDGREQTGRNAESGDLIWIYESKTGRQLRGIDYDYKVGRLGIIALVKAISILERRHVRSEQYQDGSEILWDWQIRTKRVKKCFIPREQVCETLGYSLNYNFRGFGDLHSGLKGLTIEQFENINSLL